MFTELLGLVRNICVVMVKDEVEDGLTQNSQNEKELVENKSFLNTNVHECPRIDSEISLTHKAAEGKAKKAANNKPKLSEMFVKRGAPKRR